ncbi:membrane-bound lytic murein transglycosylase MltF [Nitrincola tapanii]|uniref:Membrane-bound lytic murein transglycosylase F n=1 Tax=Nitrincola tapanii TaxID=1708751 RepID=A0A5A9VZI8_9GAMM|nr:membrane-bound lytic murein transglycosylase MltF [Nitrincola tapanii]KAA0873886.1 membrane-bound lytic murein transglycosylase MltF [Nitrincola tapanii]
MFSLDAKQPVKESLLLLATLGLMFALAWINLSSTSLLTSIREQGILRVGTLNSPMTYYQDRSEDTGFEYELAQAFADYLGVELELQVANNLNQLFSFLNQRSVHLLASNLQLTDDRLKNFKPGPIYRHTTSNVIYRERRGRPAPKTLSDLYQKNLAVLANSSQAELLQKLNLEHPQLQFEIREEADTLDLMRAVQEQSLDFMLTDSFFFDTQKSFFPGLQKSFALGDAQPITWMLPGNADRELMQALQDFFNLESTQALIRDLEIRHFSPRQNPLNFFDTQSLRTHLEERFLPLETHFLQAAENTGLDWLLLAAVGYQESLWDADAVSPTGVRGIMMLTHPAAREVGVTDRTDPIQSILGGAQYLANMKERIPERIPEPDHTWFALAAYNVGLGHLADARRLTQQKGFNPDRWEDVRRHLPLLAQERYYTQLRHGYARGHEPVRYVDNIRKYMDILHWELQHSFGRLLSEQSETAERLDPESLREQSERILRNFAPSL